MSQKKKIRYLITWTAHATDVIEADNLREAIEIAKDSEPPQILDFSVALSEPDVETHPDEYELS